MIAGLTDPDSLRYASGPLLTQRWYSLYSPFTATIRAPASLGFGCPVHAALGRRAFGGPALPPGPLLARLPREPQVDPRAGLP